MLASLAFVGALTLPSLAEAGEVGVSLAEDDYGVTVRIRGLEANAQADHIVTSRAGALLFVPGDDAMAQRMRPLDRHRLDYVQVGRAGQRVAVRVVQRKKAKGLLSKHMTTTPVAGGFDVRIEDLSARPMKTIAAAVPTTVATTANNDRTAALARIAGAPPALPPAPPPVTIAAAPIAAAPVAAAPVAAAPVAAAPVAELPVIAPASDEVASDEGTRWAAASTQQGPLDIGRSAPQVGLAWLATAMLAFSGLGLVWWRRRRPMHETPQPLRVMARVSIGPKQQIVWLSAGGRSLLVGSTEHRIELLADLTESGATATAAIVAKAMGGEIPVNSPAPAPAADGKLAAFKQRLRAALGDELAGRNEEPMMPPHLEMLAGDPRWVGRKDAA
jgi:flagellar biogenesis protein FliO